MVRYKSAKHADREGEYRQYGYGNNSRKRDGRNTDLSLQLIRPDAGAVSLRHLLSSFYRAILKTLISRRFADFQEMP